MIKTKQVCSKPNMSEKTKNNLDNLNVLNSAKEPAESINSNDSYNPFEHRQIHHPNSSFGALVHLMKGSLGTGILSIPNAFKNSGLIFGLFGTAVVAFLCTHCVHILVKASHEICKRSKTPVLGFSETCGAVFEYGPKKLRKFASAAIYAVDITLLFTLVMGNCVYVVFIAESLNIVLDHWLPDNKISLRMYMVITMGFLLVSTQIRELKHLVPFSLLSNLCLIGALGITLYYTFVEINPPSSVPGFASVSTLPVFFSSVIFAIEGIGVVMPIENSMSKPQQFLGCPGVLTVAMSFVVVLYMILGFFGYLRFGANTQPSITLNLDIKEVPAQVSNILVTISVYLTYHITMFVSLDIIWRKLVAKRVNGVVQMNVAQVVMRCLFVVITIVFAIAIPNLQTIISLVGSICFSSLGLLIPAVIDTVLHWERGLGCFKWKLMKNVFLGLFSIFALIAGTATSLDALINS